MKKTFLIMAGIIVLCGSALAQGVAVPFDAEHGNLENGLQTHEIDA